MKKEIPIIEEVKEIPKEDTKPKDENPVPKDASSDDSSKKVKEVPEEVLRDLLE